MHYRKTHASYKVQICQIKTQMCLKKNSDVLEENSNLLDEYLYALKKNKKSQESIMFRLSIQKIYIVFSTTNYGPHWDSFLMEGMGLKKMRWSEDDI